MVTTPPACWQTWPDTEGEHFTNWVFGGIRIVTVTPVAVKVPSFLMLAEYVTMALLDPGLGDALPVTTRLPRGGTVCALACGVVPSSSIKTAARPPATAPPAR